MHQLFIHPSARDIYGVALSLEGGMCVCVSAIYIRIYIFICVCVVMCAV